MPARLPMLHHQSVTGSCFGVNEGSRLPLLFRHFSKLRCPTSSTPFWQDVMGHARWPCSPARDPLADVGLLFDRAAKVGAARKQAPEDADFGCSSACTRHGRAL